MLGIPLDIPPTEDTADQVAAWRRRLVSLMTGLLQAEEALLRVPDVDLSTLGDESWHVRLAAAAGVRTQDVAAARRAAAEHLQRLSSGEQLTAVDLAALRLLPGWGNVQFIVYNPTWGPQQGYCSVGDEPEDPTLKREVHLANVWYSWVRGDPGCREPGARGELNHFMVVRGVAGEVQPRTPPGGAPALAARRVLHTGEEGQGEEGHGEEGQGEEGQGKEGQGEEGQGKEGEPVAKRQKA